MGRVSLCYGCADNNNTASGDMCTPVHVMQWYAISHEGRMQTCNNKDAHADAALAASLAKCCKPGGCMPDTSFLKEAERWARVVNAMRLGGGCITRPVPPGGSDHERAALATLRHGIHDGSCKCCSSKQGRPSRLSAVLRGEQQKMHLEVEVGELDAPPDVQYLGNIGQYY